MFQVFHKIDPDFRDAENPVNFPEGFEKVAEVEAEDLGNVFYLTTHVTHEWWLNEGVTLVKESRSSSVGDVVVDAAGNRFLCAKMGWRKF
jgi:hypothetical protein